MAWLDTWLRQGGKSGLRRRLLACRRRDFRKNSRVFYTVQSEADERRLRSDGTPWPTEDQRAHLGEGVYSWDKRRHAEEYRQRLRRKTGGLRIIAFRISKRVLQSLPQIDLNALGDPGADAWFRRYSRLSNENAPPHGFSYVRRGTGNFGDEHFFAKTVFRHLRFRRQG